MPTSYAAFVAKNLRWLFAGFALCFFSSFGQTFFISLSNGDIRAAFDLSNGEFGLLYMAATLASAATLPMLGWLLDRYRAWRVSLVTMLCLALACAMMALAASLPLLVLTIYLLRLFGQGMMTEIAMTATGRWFAANRGRAMALVTLGLHAGTGLLPIVFVGAAAALGWRGTWIASAAILLLLALPMTIAAMARERDPLGDPPPVVKGPAVDWTMAEVLKSPTFWLISLAVLAPPFIGTTLFFHQVYLTDLRGWAPESFALGFLVMSATTVGFSIAAGGLIDRFSALRLLPFFLVPMALSCFVAAFVASEAAIVVFMILLGISNGFSSTLLGALWPEIYGTRHLGQIRSVTVAQMVLASALGPGITGVLIDAGVDYLLQIAVMGGYSVLMTAVMALMAPRLSRAAGALASGEPAPLVEQGVDRLDPEPRRP